MFVRPCWKPDSDEEVLAFIAKNPWALLISNGPEGPYATNLALMLDRSRGEKPVLVGHIARANEHSAAIEAGTGPVLAVFQGPYSYVTSSWYPNRDMPPTYYYTAAHCYGSVRVQSESELHRWVVKLTHTMEEQIPNGWRVTEVAESEITRRLKSIVGFEINIDHLEGKFKLGQDEPRKDAMAVAEHLSCRVDQPSQDLARMVRKYNAGRKEG